VEILRSDKLILAFNHQWKTGKKEKAGTDNQLFVNRKGSLGPIEGCCGNFSASLISETLFFLSNTYKNII